MEVQKISVLIIGGTRFMGRSLVLKLAANESIDLHIMNRKNPHWDNEVGELMNVRWTYADRKQHNEFTKYLRYYNKKYGFGENGKMWDLVVDFCAYERKDVKSIVRGLGGLVKLYV